jgi:hypothetical protein
MKKAILVFAAFGLTYQGIAQDKYVTSANVAINQQHFDEAKEDIDKAMQSPETKEKPKALLAKAQIYLALQGVDKYKASNPYHEAIPALFKLIEVKPDYEKSTVDQLLGIGAFLYYNDGAKAYNDKRLAEAGDDMRMVLKIHDLKRFDKMPADRLKVLDTLTAQASMTLANSAYYQGKYDEAIPLLTSVKSNPITKTPSVYQCLIDAMQRQGKSTESLAVIQEGRKLFPDDVTIRNFELNYFISSGKQDEIAKKLEEAAAKEPNNADLQFNLATTYLSMATSKDGNKSTNNAELVAKSEQAFQKALKISPDNATYNYNFGALYFNQATEVNNQMNAITGSSDADQKKYDKLKADRDALFAKSSPYFEKANSTFAANEKGLKDEEKRTYKNTLKALMDIYSRLSKMDKYGDVKKKYESMN